MLGGGLAGSEAAWQAARLGAQVILHEMRPHVMTPAHRTSLLAELVCSNSFRGVSLENGPGLLKEELRLLGSLVMEVALANRVPGGGALAVDREGFAAGVTAAVTSHPRIEVRREEVKALPDPGDGAVVVATGPLTAPDLADDLLRRLGEEYLYFYDAAAPVVTAESVDRERCFRASRYGKGEADAYLNCPLTEEEYERLWRELVAAEQASRHAFDPVPFFEGCLPVEEMARRGRDTLRFGPLKPVGLHDPRTGREPYAVVQLRQDDRDGTLYNLVGFQTALRWRDQDRILRLVPALARAEFVRYGVMHRNLFLCSPRLLRPTLQWREDGRVFFAGQMIGVEGYVESAAAGLVAGVNAARLVAGDEPLVFPRETAMGSLCHYVTTAVPATFQPMNAAYGLLPPPERPVRDRRRRRLAQARRALASLVVFARMYNLLAAEPPWGEAGPPAGEAAGRGSGGEGGWPETAFRSS